MRVPPYALFSGCKDMFLHLKKESFRPIFCTKKALASQCFFLNELAGLWINYPGYIENRSNATGSYG